MQIYKTFFKVMKKYKISIALYTAIIVFMLVAITAATSPDSETVEDNRYTILVVDNDQSEISKELVNFLGTKHILKEGTYTDEQIKDLLYYLNIKEYIVIPKGFGDKFTDLVNNQKAAENVSASDSDIAESLLESTYDEAMPYAVFINLQINQYLNAVKDYMASGTTLKDASAKCSEAMDSTKYVSMQKKEVLTTQKVYTTFQFLPFGILTIIFSGALPVVMSFNDSEKKNRMIISSHKITSRNVALVLGTTTLSLVVTAILITISSIRNSEYAFTDSWWLAIANTILYTISITMLLSMITSLPIGSNNKETNNSNSFITCIIGLAFSFLGGTFVDITILGDKVAKVGRFIPNYWYSVGCRRIWYEGAGLDDVLGCFGMQLLFGFVCLSIGLCFTKFFGDRKA